MAPPESVLPHGYAADRQSNGFISPPWAVGGIDSTAALAPDHRQLVKSIPHADRLSRTATIMMRCLSPAYQRGRWNGRASNSLSRQPKQ